jgi:hypothetical protein
MKNYIGISRDHSGSMSHIAQKAAEDYNSTIQVIKDQSKRFNIDTIVSVVECGVGRPAVNKFVVKNSSIDKLVPMGKYEYHATGNATPLFDSVLMLIKQLEAVPDYDDPTVAFLVNVITDGVDNNSEYGSVNELIRKIKNLQNTDKWTFVFRVPKGSKTRLVQMGIPSGNILEWEQSERGMQESTVATTQAFESYYNTRSMGATSVNKFYADLSNVSVADVKANLVDISKDVLLFMVTPADDGMQIRDFINMKNHNKFVKGNSYYQLTKTETLQEYKEIFIQNKLNGHVYSGASARHLLGLPLTGAVKVAPGNHGTFNIFVQSTSVNRKVVKNTFVMVKK